MLWISVLFGLAILFFGRRLFWLFVGCVGFIAGFEIAGAVLPEQPEWLILLIAFGAGLLGAIASTFLQRVFVIIAGFFAGGYCLSTLASVALHSEGDGIMWMAFAIGGLLGGVLTAVLLDPALIILSSLAGATAVSQNVPLDPSAKTLLFVPLLFFGIAVQAAHYARETKLERVRRTE